MIIKIVYNNDDFYNNLITKLKELPYYSLLVIEAYDENYYKDKKKAVKIKASLGTKLCPFVAIYNGKTVTEAFYSDSQECTDKNIINYLNKIYESDDKTD